MRKTPGKINRGSQNAANWLPHTIGTPLASHNPTHRGTRGR
jgi:hypothetical protein